DASSHYVLAYEPRTAAKSSEYRHIEVKVRRPGVRLSARPEYFGAGNRPPAPMSIPGGLSPLLRTLLAGVIPDDGLPMRVQAVPVSRHRHSATMSIVVEVNGSALGSEHPDRLSMEQGLLTLNAGGKASNGTRRLFD